MAIVTWWHGQNHRAAPMGKTAGVAGWDGEEHTGTALKKNVNSISGKGQQLLRNSKPTSSPTKLWRSRRVPSTLWLLQLLFSATLLFISPSNAVFINFENCMSPETINSEPRLLQFVPLFVWATFNASAARHNINITAYGNVTGMATKEQYPAIDDPRWKNPNDTIGKIPDVYQRTNNYTKYTTQLKVLDYTPYNLPGARFCNSSAFTHCPLSPVFYFNGTK